MIDRALFLLIIFFALTRVSVAQETRENWESSLVDALPAADSGRPEQAAETLRDTFRKLASPRAALAFPSYSEIQRLRALSQFAPAASKNPNGAPSAFPLANRNSAESYYQGASRHIEQRAEGFFVHPAGGRVDVGAGYADIKDRFDANGYYNHEIPKYGAVRLNLGKLGKNKPRVLAPTGSYTESELSPKALVSRQDITVETVRRSLSAAVSR